MTPHLDYLGETVLMIGPNMCFKGIIWKIVPKLSLLPLIWSAAEVQGAKTVSDSSHENRILLVIFGLCLCIAVLDERKV